jgi:hypothetical protein
MPNIVHNILTKTAEDSGHINLDKAKWIDADMSGPVPVRHTLRAGALFVYRGGLERELILSPELVGIGFNPQKSGYTMIKLVFSSIPVMRYERLSTLDAFGPVFLIMKMEEKKEENMIVGPGRVWEQGYFIAGVVELTPTSVTLAGKRGTPI